MSTATLPDRECRSCKKSEAADFERLKVCGRCKDALYCSSECQKSDWKAHKPQCGTPDPDMQTSPGSSLHPFNMFRSSGNKAYLHFMSQTEVYDQLTDAYRMRVEDMYNFHGDASGLYCGDDPRPEFKRFLIKMEQSLGLLPAWWSKKKRKICEQRAVDPSNWSNINCKVKKGDIQEHYKNPLMPLTLRMLAALICGSEVI